MRLADTVVAVRLLGAAGTGRVVAVAVLEYPEKFGVS
jgi:hypothetical protein